MFGWIASKYLYSRFLRKWRRINAHNFTIAGNIFPVEKVSIGRMSYGVLNIHTYGNEREKLDIGSFCSIAGGVHFILGGEHPYRNISTFPFRKYVLSDDEHTATKGPIRIHDDVWIGENSIILSGVEISQGAIVAAGSVVTKNIPPYAIFAGGIVKKYRFSEETIAKLIQFDYSKLTDRSIKENMDLLYANIDEQELDEIIARLLET